MLHCTQQKLLDTGIAAAEKQFSVYLPSMNKQQSDNVHLQHD